MNMLMNKALAATAEVMPLGDRLAYALRMLLVGVLMVFVVLGLIWLVLTLMRVFTYDIPRHRAEKSAPAPTAPAKAVYTMPAAPAADDAALVAAITAAITAYRDEAGESGAFRVVSFRQAENGRAWNRK